MTAFAALFVVSFLAVAVLVHDALPTTAAVGRILLDLVLAAIVCLLVEFARYELRRCRRQTR